MPFLEEVWKIVADRGPEVRDSDGGKDFLVSITRSSIHWWRRETDEKYDLKPKLKKGETLQRVAADDKRCFISTSHGRVWCGTRSKLQRLRRLAVNPKGEQILKMRFSDNILVVVSSVRVSFYSLSTLNARLNLILKQEVAILHDSRRTAIEARVVRYKGNIFTMIANVEGQVVHFKIRELISNDSHDWDYEADCSYPGILDISWSGKVTLQVFGGHLRVLNALTKEPCGKDFSQNREQDGDMMASLFEGPGRSSLLVFSSGVKYPDFVISEYAKGRCQCDDRSSTCRGHHWRHFSSTNLDEGTSAWPWRLLKVIPMGLVLVPTISEHQDYYSMFDDDGYALSKGNSIRGAVTLVEWKDEISRSRCIENTQADRIANEDLVIPAIDELAYKALPWGVGPIIENLGDDTERTTRWLVQEVTGGKIYYNSECKD